jgi:hypothetical protein
MKQYLTLLLALSCLGVKAQDSTVRDSIPGERMDNFQIYLAPGYSVSQFVGTHASFGEIHLGMVYLKKIDIGINYTFNLDNFQKQLIFPTVHYYDQQNIGIRAHYLFLKKKFRFHAGAGYQMIEAAWTPEEDKDETFIDQISFMEIYGGVSWLINKTFTLQGDVGYSIANGVDLIGFESDDFGGLKALVMLKIGLINF